MMREMMLTQIYTTFLDFMVTLTEASKCLQVDDYVSRDAKEFHKDNLLLPGHIMYMSHLGTQWGRMRVE